MGELLNIQALRALAAYLVLSTHIAQLFYPLAPDLPLGMPGQLGVDLFFVISGFIIVHAVSARPRVAGAFFAGRVLRIVPLYWIVTLAVFPLLLIFPALSHATEIGVAALLRSLFFIPFTKADGTVTPLLFVGWTLNYEMFFYALIALGLLLRKREWAFAGAAIAICALVVWGAVEPPHEVLGAFYTNSILLEFVYGMVIGVITLQRAAIPRQLTRTAVLAILVLLLIVLPYALGMGDAARVIRFGLPAAGIVTLAVILELGGVVCTQPFIQRLGEASYSIYLTHVFVTQCAISAMRQMSDFGWVAALGLAVFCLVGATRLGLWVYDHVEKPLRQIAQRPPRARRFARSRPA
jgi:peptidoglycan/LPS O-acetylase OafA/YrhL